MRHTTITSLLALAALSFSACSTTQVPLNIDQEIPKRAGASALTIISPANFSIGISFTAYTNYDYFLDCLEDRCKVGKMNALQYITIYPPSGEHTIYTKLSDEGLTNTLVRIDKNDTASIKVSTHDAQRTFIQHSWERSAKMFAVGIAIEPSMLQEIDETNASSILQNLINSGNRISVSGFGQRGTTY